MSAEEARPEGSVDLRLRGPVAWITLNRPERLNAFAGGMRDELYHALCTAAESQDIRVVVITGAGRAFCAGADVDVMAELLTTGDERGFAQLVEAGMRVVLKLRGMSQLVIAAVNGVAAGAGASLAAACDLRIASESAQIGFTFNRIGLHPDWGATYTLPRLVGEGRAAELIYSARMLPSAEAAALGLFERVVPAGGFHDTVGSWAEELAAKPPLAMAGAKHTLERAAGSDLQTMLDAEAAVQLQCFRSRDVREGLTAFREKRRPHFRGE